MTENKRFQWIYIKDNTLELRDNGIVKVFNNERLEELLNDLSEENEKLKDEFYDELDNALTVLTKLYEVIPISSQSKMNRLYNRLKSLRDDIND